MLAYLTYYVETYIPVTIGSATVFPKVADRYHVSLEIMYFDAKIHSMFNEGELKQYLAPIGLNITKRLKCPNIENFTRLVTIKTFRYLQSKYPYILTLKVRVTSTETQESVELHLAQEEVVIENKED